ncbi:MAG: hypothetical protein IMZ62_00525 [Chloroflexi bacterium]|nr:hypothetical protein [Chloroflexota bacterium]
MSEIDPARLTWLKNWERNTTRGRDWPIRILLLATEQARIDADLLNRAHYNGKAIETQYEDDEAEAAQEKLAAANKAEQEAKRQKYLADHPEARSDT